MGTPPTARRGPTARKRASGGILAAVGALAILFSGVMQALTVVSSIADKAERNARKAKRLYDFLEADLELVKDLAGGRLAP